MLYPEFNQYKSLLDPQYPRCNFYENDAGDRFYVEPGFYTALMGYGEKTSHLPLILNRIDEIVRANHRVIFTNDFEFPMVHKDDYIYQELIDITDQLNVTWIDDTRPSDYGD